MPRPSRIPLFVASVLSFSLASCRARSGPNLRNRILAANTSQYCRLPDACFNPLVLAIEDGFEVTTFQGSKPTHVHVLTRDLARYLQSLPMQAWPRGPSIVLSRSDDVTDEKAIERNLDIARQLFRSAGLTIEFRPGG